MGLLFGDGDAVTGIVRVTTSQPATREAGARYISVAEANGMENEYSTNIQVAELNALNASLAVVSWKRTVGFYGAAGEQVYAGYSIRSGALVTEEAA